jgi:hypothetical protein
LPRTVLNHLRLLVRPETVLRWHRDLIDRRHARRSRPHRVGRPRTVRSIRRLVLRLASENSTWGYRRIHGELLVLGVKVAASTVWAILKDAGIGVVLSGVRMPRMNSIMERWIQACRHELLDRTLIFNRAHLLQALREYEHHHNEHRPHRGIANVRPLRSLPEPITEPATLARLRIRRHDRLGGLLHEYDSAGSSTNTIMPPDQHGRHFRHPQGPVCGQLYDSDRVGGTGLAPSLSCCLSTAAVRFLAVQRRRADLRPVPGQPGDQGVLATPGHIPLDQKHRDEPLLNRPFPIALGGPGAVTVRGPSHRQRRRYRRRRCTTTRTVTRQSTCSAA